VKVTPSSSCANIEIVPDICAAVKKSEGKPPLSDLQAKRRQRHFARKGDAPRIYEHNWRSIDWSSVTRQPEQGMSPSCKLQSFMSPGVARKACL